MRIIVGTVGCLIILIVLWDAFEAIILPRRVSRKLRLMSLYYQGSWTLLSSVARWMRPGKRRERYLGYFGPLSLIMLLVIWGVAVIFGFAMLQWSTGATLAMPGGGEAGFGTYLYMSGVTFYTLGFGDVIPLTSLGRGLSVVEAGTGFGLLAIVIGYLPVIYQGFSRREINISLLDARAGSPPSATELIVRHGRERNLGELNNLLREWERWSAELLESHLSYPVLTYFRSQHENQSWLAALTTILDSCTLIIVGIENGPVWQAGMTFAMSRHALVDLAQVFNTAPRSPDPDRLPPQTLALVRKSLTAAGVRLRDGDEAEQKLTELRRMYEPYVNSMAHFLFMSLPPWIHPQNAMDNWQTSAWERNPMVFASTTAPTEDYDYPESD